MFMTSATARIKLFFPLRAEEETSLHDLFIRFALPSVVTRAREWSQKNIFIPIRVNNIIFPCKRLVGCNFFSQLAKAQCKILFHKILTNNHPPSVIMHRKRSAAGLYIDTFMLSWIRCQGQSMGELEPYGTSSTSFAVSQLHVTLKFTE